MRYGRMPEAVIEAAVNDGAKVVYAALAMLRHHRTGRCSPSQADLARVTGKSVRSISRAVRQLERAGLVVVATEAGRETTYQLLHLDGEEEDAPTCSGEDPRPGDQGPSVAAPERPHGGTGAGTAPTPPVSRPGQAPAVPAPGGAGLTPVNGDRGAAAATPANGDRATPDSGDRTTPDNGDRTTPDSGDRTTPDSGDRRPLSWMSGDPRHGCQGSPHTPLIVKELESNQRGTKRAPAGPPAGPPTREGTDPQERVRMDLRERPDEPEDDFVPDPAYSPNGFLQQWEKAGLPLPRSVHWAEQEIALRRLHHESPHWSQADVATAIAKLIDDHRGSKVLRWAWQQGPAYLVRQRPGEPQGIEKVLTWEPLPRTGRAAEETIKERLDRRQREREEKQHA